MKEKKVRQTNDIFIYFEVYRVGKTAGCPTSRPETKTANQGVFKMQ